jgi:hypothetical protein
MYTVYQNATLVIAASAASGPSAGLFTGSPSFQWRHEICQEFRGEMMRIHIRRYLDHHAYEAYPAAGMRGVAPLLRRAWAFQERVLARRMLHFFDNEVLWECQDGVDCQCGQGSDLRRAHFAADSVGVWGQWVSIYSDLAITYPSDRLPAVSGLANYLHGLHTDSLGGYLAGLWTKRLIEDLQWWVGEYRAVMPRPAVWRAPTWSWASTDNPVFMPKVERATIHVTVLEAQCSPKGPDSFGQVVSGYIILSGALAEVKLRAWLRDKPNNLFLRGFEVGKVETKEFCKVQMDNSWERTLQWLDIGPTPRSNPGSDSWADTRSDGGSDTQPHMLQHRDEFYCLELATTGNESQRSLLLKKLDAGGNRYERIGLAWSTECLFGGDSQNTIVKIV